MNFDKIEKRLPDEIISLIDHEASTRGISKQEVISLLVSAVNGNTLDEENRRLKVEIEVLEKFRDDERKEIKFLREENSKFSDGLTSLDVPIGGKKGNGEQQTAVNVISDQIRELAQGISLLRQIPEKEETSVI